MAYLFTVGIQAQKNFRNGNDFAIKLDGGPLYSLICWQ